MQDIVVTFWKQEEGQDLIEYSLVIAFVLIACTAMMIANGGGVQGILFTTTANLNAAKQAAS
jgi:Flp pilus assembly pilin Flp